MFYLHIGVKNGVAVKKLPHTIPARTVMAAATLQLLQFIFAGALALWGRFREIFL